VVGRGWHWRSGMPPGVGVCMGVQVLYDVWGPLPHFKIWPSPLCLVNLSNLAARCSLGAFVFIKRKKSL
jgi:hypothetical protein